MIQVTVGGGTAVLHVGYKCVSRHLFNSFIASVPIQWPWWGFAPTECRSSLCILVYFYCVALSGTLSRYICTSCDYALVKSCCFLFLFNAVC